MIRKLSEISPWHQEFHEICSTLKYTSEKQTIKRLESLLEKQDVQVLGVFEKERMTGIFAFMLLADEHYMEMLVGLAAVDDAYEEMMQYLEENYAGWQADLVFDPSDTALRNTLVRREAEFFTEQQRMRLENKGLRIETDGIQSFSEPYAEQYYAIHEKDLYWTGEKTAAAPERFNIFLAVDHDAVCGYIDVTNCHEENEPFSLLVVPEYRQRGWGRKLLAKAIESNGSSGMALQVDVDNIPAIRLYESAGFVKVPGGNSQAATWHIPLSRKK